MGECADGMCCHAATCMWGDVRLQDVAGGWMGVVRNSIRRGGGLVTKSFRGGGVHVNQLNIDEISSFGYLSLK